MAKKRQDEMQRILELALAPGTFIGYRDRADFIATLETVRARITSLVRHDRQSIRAIALLGRSSEPHSMRVWLRVIGSR